MNIKVPNIFCSGCLLIFLGVPVKRIRQAGVEMKVLKRILGGLGGKDVWAQPYSSRLIRMIVAYPPGGGTDIVGRAMRYCKHCISTWK